MQVACQSPHAGFDVPGAVSDPEFWPNNFGTVGSGGGTASRRLQKLAAAAQNFGIQPIQNLEMCRPSSAPGLVSVRSTADREDRSPSTASSRRRALFSLLFTVPMAQLQMAAVSS
jgi:hypothetical protein